jgi:flagellar biosynthesis/type III secretory pathway protein FliH
MGTMDPRTTEEFKKGYEAAKIEYTNILEDEGNIKAFIEGYKQGYKDGMEEVKKSLEKQMQNFSMDEDGVQPFVWPKIP